MKEKQTGYFKSGLKAAFKNELGGMAEFSFPTETDLHCGFLKAAARIRSHLPKDVRYALKRQKRREKDVNFNPA